MDFWSRPIADSGESKIISGHNRIRLRFMELSEQDCHIPGGLRRLLTSSWNAALPDRDCNKWIEQLVQISLWARCSPPLWQLHHPNTLIRGMQKQEAPA